MHKKSRWSKVYESSEEELVTLLKSLHLDAERINAEESGDTTEQRSDLLGKLWCAEGSLTVRQADGYASLQTGDAIRLDPNIAYTLVAGIAGYVCYITS